MEHDKPCHPRPKHLPERIPKIDKFNCPTRAEIARIESVKPRDAEGTLIRRRWKEKVLAAQKEIAADEARAFYLKRTPSRPMETIEEEELCYPNPKRLPELIPKIDKYNCPTKTQIARIERVKPRDAAGVKIRQKWKEKVLAAQKEIATDERKHDTSAVRTFQLRRAPPRQMETIKDEESVEVPGRKWKGRVDTGKLPSFSADILGKETPTATERAIVSNAKNCGNREKHCQENVLKEGSKKEEQERQERTTTNNIRNCENEGQQLEESTLRKGNEPFPKMEDLESNETFMFKVPLDEQFSVNPFLGEASDEHIFEKPPQKSGGTHILDKILSGEYVVGRPPKKPGGTLIFLLLMLSLLLSGVECKNVKDEGNRKWGLGHVILSVLMSIVLFVYLKYKNRIAVAYMRWYFDDQVEEFLSRFKSRNNLSCRKVILAMRRDFNRYLKTKKLRGEKTVQDFKENVDAYLANLHGEMVAASRVIGHEWEWAAILHLEQICNHGRVMGLEANVSEEEISNVEEQFQLELDSFLARFDFQGAELSFYRLVLGWHLSYDEVSRALWKKFRETYGEIACEQNGFELGLEHDPIDIMSTFFTKIEGEIDEIYISKHGDQEWEKVGMNYFMKLCDKTTEYGNNQTSSVDSHSSHERRSCFETTGTADLDESSPMSGHDTIKSDNEVSMDKREDGSDSFFEMFVIAAEVFLSQDNEVCSGEFLEFAISAL